jgi:hypothetical protein
LINGRSTPINWVWISGTHLTYVYGSYGTKGVASSGSFPGTRILSASWIDKNNNLWLFGGWGDDSGTPEIGNK